MVEYSGNQLYNYVMNSYECKKSGNKNSNKCHDVDALIYCTVVPTTVSLV